MIELDNLTLGYDRHPAVHHLDATIARGSLLAVVGPNGAGKSTLLKGILGLLRPLQGEVRLHGVVRHRVAYLPQQIDLDRTFPLRVDELVSFGLWHRVGALRSLTRHDRTAIAEALAAVGLNGFAGRPIGALSGGQFQRALFARVLLQDAPLILLDEPFTAIDTRTAEDLLALVRRWHGEARTVIAVLHDLDQVRSHFPTAMLLARELVAAGPTAEVLRGEHLFRARQMAEAHDERAPVCRRRAA
ncbi:zinc ABC transporter ATP-binding protein AztA [Halochromatium glycolicum]|uniref:ABC transporter n=1 Tax=Halochromatium glycolicum TaxID=85075 RepID=A0AAJ0U7S0_9GAMM|nr:zinc ABC transporter ATP-binding protein AztA [Halochromatium glycolicum]MBK1706047.1 ABC transporter [Halochromatium glycolicum]